jgi:nucleotide-binding universal stress UspA family protein
MFETVIAGLEGSAADADAVALAELLAAPAADILHTHIHSGRPVARGLHEAAIASGADLIVVGSSGRGVLGRILAGDDVRETLRSAPCAVAVAPHGFAATGAAIAEIGVGYDGSEHAQVALDTARAIAARERAHVRALGVASPPQGLVTPLGTSAILAIEARRQRTQRYIIQLSPDISAHAVDGIPHQRLAELSGDVDLLIVGSSRRGPFGRVLLGSTSESLSRETRCPLLVVPAPASSRRERARPTPRASEPAA